MIRFFAIYVAAVFVVGAGVSWFFYSTFRAPAAPAAQATPVRSGGTGGGAAKVAPNGGGIELAAATRRSFGPSPLPLSLPLSCTPGVDCFVLNYVDDDPGPGRADYRCGQMSYDGHKGTDFALVHDGPLDEGVPVLASAAGRVVGVRDGMRDVSIAVAGKESVKDRECGNGVRLDHGGGWTTQYCHMKRGSVAVKNGDQVRTGDRLGSVGLSGMTEFLHVHVTVEKDGKVVDPFRGLGDGPACDMGDAPLWRPELLASLSYLSPLVYNAGFADRIPSNAEVYSGGANAMKVDRTSQALVFWATMAGLKPGDFVALRVLGPDGRELANRTQKLESHRIRSWLAVGRSAKGEWPSGRYQGMVTVHRDEPAGPREIQRVVPLEIR